MFDIGWGKIIIIAVIALIVIGPKELPAVLRTVGQWMGKIRRMAAEFQNQFQEAMREAEMADLKKHVDTITEATRDISGGFDPLKTVTRNIESVFDDKPAGTASTTPSTATETAGAVAAADSTAAATPPAPPAEPELPFAEPLPPVTSRDIVPEPTPTPAAAPAAPAAAPETGGRPA
jgi:sec-independent protein translocase protein TatB